MQTLVIDAGRKDKLRPADILGALQGMNARLGAMEAQHDLQFSQLREAVIAHNGSAHQRRDDEPPYDPNAGSYPTLH